MALPRFSVLILIVRLKGVIWWVRSVALTSAQGVSVHVSLSATHWGGLPGCPVHLVTGLFLLGVVVVFVLRALVLLLVCPALLVFMVCGPLGGACIVFLWIVYIGLGFWPQ